MTEEKKGLIRKTQEFVNYVDIFSLALALTTIRKFSSDNFDWHRAIYEICQKYKDIPELKGITFDGGRPPLCPPMADEVYQLQCLLLMCGEVVGGGGLGKDHFLYIPPGMRTKIKKDESKRLTKYAEQIEDMAAIFDKHLKFKKPK